MKLPSSLRQFVSNECGLVSVDWMALSITIIGTIADGDECPCPRAAPSGRIHDIGTGLIPAPALDTPRCHLSKDRSPVPMRPVACTPVVVKIHDKMGVDVVYISGHGKRIDLGIRSST